MSAVEIMKEASIPDAMPGHYATMRAANLFNEADRLSEWRGKIAPFLSVTIACLPENPAGFIVTMHAIDTDRRDGRAAREAVALLGPEAKTTEEGAAKDHENDKKFVNSILPAIAAKDFANNRKTLGTIVAAATLANIKRDELMAQTRALASENDIDTKAIPINKLKTGSIMAGIGLETVPLYGNLRKFERVKPVIRTSLIVGGVAIGIVGQRVYRKQVEKQLTDGTKATTKPNRYFSPY